MERSAFPDSGRHPEYDELAGALGKSTTIWNELNRYILEHCPGAFEEWNFSKFGWNYRLRDKKRVIVYMMPGKHLFRVSLVLGRKAIAEAMGAKLSDEMKSALTEAKAYAEGTGVRIEVKRESTLADIKELVALKLKY